MPDGKVFGTIIGLEDRKDGSMLITLKVPEASAITARLNRMGDVVLLQLAPEEE